MNETRLDDTHALAHKRYKQDMTLACTNLIKVGGSDIHTTTEPPSTSFSLKVTIVEVHSRAMRVLYVCRHVCDGEV